MTKSKSDLFLIAMVLFLLVSLGVSLILVKQRQNIQKRASSDTADLTFQPNSGNYSVNNTFSTGVWVNTGSQKVNIVKIVVRFDKNKLHVDSAIQVPVKTTSLKQENIAPPTPDEANASGEIIMSYGVQSGHLDQAPSGAFQYATIPFKAIAEGDTIVSFYTNSIRIVQQVDDQFMTLTPHNVTYTVGGGSTPPAGTSPTPTGTIAPTPTATVIPTPTVTRPPNAPIIARLSNYCGPVSSTESDSVLAIYGSKFGATQGTSKVTFHYKKDSTVAADSTYKDKDVTDYVSWSDTMVVVKIPAVEFPKNASGVDQDSVVSKVVIKTAAEPVWPFTFPTIDLAFYKITHLNPTNIGDLDCSNSVNLDDFVILFNNYDPKK